MVHAARKPSLKSPRFFCEHCGAEVARDAKACPRCGRFFASVRCPACGYAGAESRFAGGCPVCGYSSAGGARNRLSGPKKPSRPAGPLPLWIYLFSVLALLCIIVLFCVVAR
ncbi:MAG: zinc ribbon domain-containing protein [Treponema sp.]|nr:zinc ribbon domain-containing protein [Treponema sp.]